MKHRFQRSLILVILILICFAPNLLAQDKLISFDFKTTDIQDVLRALASQAGVNLVVDKDVCGIITIQLNKVTFQQALDLITTTNDLTYTKTTNLYRITPVDHSFLKIDLTDGLLDLEARDVKLDRLIRELAQKTGANLVPSQDLQDRITFAISKVAVPEAVQALLVRANCMEETVGKVNFIRKKSTPPVPFTVNFVNNRLTVDAKNVPIVSLCRTISEKTGVAVVPDQNLTSNISIYLQSVPLDDGLSVLCETNGLQLSEDGLARRISKGQNSNQNKNIKITYNPGGKLFDLSVQNAPIASVINEMAERANLNVVVLERVTGNVNNLRLQNLKFTEALDFLLKGTIFFYKMVDNVYIVGAWSPILPENKDFLETKIYPVKYLKADQILNALPATIPRVNFTLITEKNALVFTAPSTVHSLFSSYLKQVDVPDVNDRTEVVKVKYLKAEDMLKLIPSSLKTDMTVVTASNAIAVTGPQNIVNQVKTFIEKLDQVNPLIVFEITVVQISDTDSSDWEAPSGVITLSNGRELSISASNGGITLNKAGTNTDDALFSLTALVSKGLAKVVANPTITTLNGCKASFDVCTKYNYNVASSVTDDTTSYTIKTYDSGLYFTITPWVALNKQITMEIQPKLSEFGDAPDGSTLPSTTEREVSTTVRVADGQTVIISGLKSTRNEVSESKVPILGDIPLLGRLFKNKSVSKTQDEFVVVIKPTLVFDPVGQDRMNRKVQEKMEPEVNKELLP